MNAKWPSLLVLGALALLAVVVWLVFRVGAESASVEGIAADGLCRAPLPAYCTDACPSYAHALRRTQEREPLLIAEAGTCGNLKWVTWSSGFHGETAYFGARDELVCVEGWKDYSGYCAGRSASVIYGERPDCVRETILTIKGRAAESVAGSP